MIQISMLNFAAVMILILTVAACFLAIGFLMGKDSASRRQASVPSRITDRISECWKHDNAPKAKPESLSDDPWYQAQRPTWEEPKVERIVSGAENIKAVPTMKGELR